MQKPKPGAAFAVLREVDGEVHIDLTTLSGIPEVSRQKAEHCDKLAPSCAVGMPVVGMASVEVRVIEYWKV